MHQDTFVFTNEQLQAFIRRGVSTLLEKSPFTVAIIGQMKVGKSTLLNALVERDLAPTGVAETTATINRFVYGSGAECDKFRIHFKDDAVDPADEPLENLANWLGEMSDIEKVKCLEFRADAAFLKDYHLIDTPGTRNVVTEHEEVINAFLAEKREGETLAHGSRANAVLYAINPNVRADDMELLQWFGSETRLPGSLPYNSIAVIQKWEALTNPSERVLEQLRNLAEREEAAWARFLPEKPDPDELKPDPLAIVQLRRAALQAALAGEVAHVIPVSGLLANQLRDVPDDVWPALAKLGAESPGEGLGTLLFLPAYFAEDVPGVSLDTVERQGLLDAVPWHILRFSVRLAYAREIGDGDDLRRTVEEACGIQTLKKALEERFIEVKVREFLEMAKTETAKELANRRDSIEAAQEQRTEEKQQTAAELEATAMNNKIAIDFGTSRTKVAYLDPDTQQPELMPLGRDPSVPSLFNIDPDSEKVWIGDDAFDRLEDNPHCTITRLKRGLSRSFRFGRRRVVPKALLTTLFSEIRERAGREIPGFDNVPPTAVQLTFTYLNSMIEINLLKAAAQAAGFKTVELVSEPEAAARAWQAAVSDNHYRDAIVLDCGGSLVDWCYLRRTESGMFRHEPTLTQGEVMCGGETVDEELVALVNSKFPHQVSNVPFLRQHCRVLKERYCRERGENSLFKIEADGHTKELEGSEIQTVIDEAFITPVREAFKPYLDKVKERTKREDLAVLLVGGSANLKGLKEALEGEFGCQVFKWHRSEFATVLGAVLPVPME